MEHPLHEKCPYSEFCWSAFSRIRTEYGEILCISPYSVRMREKTDQKNSEYGHVSCSDHQSAAFTCPEFFLTDKKMPIGAFHIETCHLICDANQMTSFYKKYNTGLKWVYRFHVAKLKKNGFQPLTIVTKRSILVVAAALDPPLTLT